MPLEMKEVIGKFASQTILLIHLRKRNGFKKRLDSLFGVPFAIVVETWLIHDYQSRHHMPKKK